VAAESARYAGRPFGQADERHLRFAALIRAERAAILTSYAKGLDALRCPVLAKSRARDQALKNGSQVIAGVAARVQGDEAKVQDLYGMQGWTARPVAADSQLAPADMVSAAAVFFTVNSLARHIKDDPELLPCFVTAVLALNESIGRQLKEATLAYTGYLLERVDEAQIDERHRIARDLHDRLGEGLSVALRQLELHEISSREDPRASHPRAAIAKHALGEAMRRLREVTSDLRQDSIRSLEKALVGYIDSLITSADMRLRVSGEETWAPPIVIGEAFLIIREAIRNALMHGSPRIVLIGVVLGPDELRAWVEDNGRGFASAVSSDAVSAGTGLTSMRERATQVGGRVTIASVPGQGTHVELLMPLPGHRND
jgi:signal transduction histidine kinase